MTDSQKISGMTAEHGEIESVRSFLEAVVSWNDTCDDGWVPEALVKDGRCILENWPPELKAAHFASSEQVDR